MIRGGTTLIIFLILALPSESNSQPVPDKKLKTLKVGMSYDEVQKTIGRPIELRRGATRLSSIPAFDSAVERFEARAFIDTLSDNEAAIFDFPTIEDFGQLLYVRWIYSNKKIDRNYIPFPKHINGVRVGFIKNYILTVYQFSVLFDAASGRVVDFGYYPLQVMAAED